MFEGGEKREEGGDQRYSSMYCGGGKNIPGIAAYMVVVFVLNLRRDYYRQITKGRGEGVFIILHAIVI